MNRAAATETHGPGSEPREAQKAPKEPSGKPARAKAKEPDLRGKDRLTLKDMVRGASTTARAVRFYEEQHLLQTLGRSPGGHRLFSAAELPKLKLILELRTCGFSIEEIRDILLAKSHYGTVREAAMAIQGMLTSHMRELQNKIETIQRLGQEFSVSINLLDRCIHCTDPRGAAACTSCDLPMAVGTPKSFGHIWAVSTEPRPGIKSP